MRILWLALALASFVGADAAAQSAAPSVAAPSVDVRGLSLERMDAERAHLWRVAAWGGVNVLGGLALALSAERNGASRARWSFGAMSAGWGAVNIGIAAAGLAAAGSTPDTTFAAALSSERFFHDVLLVNLGLNVGYAGVGGAAWLAGSRDVRDAPAWRGVGTSLILQGAGLFVLDGVAFLASRARLGQLLGVSGDLSTRALPTGVAITLHL